jgi:hypothetical protein
MINNKVLLKFKPNLKVLLPLGVLLSGCVSPIVTYVPTDGQSVVYSGGVGAISDVTSAANLEIYPTFKYQAPNEVPTFTLMVTNNSDQPIDFDPASIASTIDAHSCHVYTLEERVAEIRRVAKNKQIALAIAGGLAAGAAAYNASHQTTHYSSWGYVGNRPVFMSGTIQTYNPAAGMFAGMAVGAATGVGIHQIAQAAGNQEQVAQGIFQRTTIAPGATAVGQVQIKAGGSSFSNIRLTVPVSGQSVTASFDRKVTQ